MIMPIPGTSTVKPMEGGPCCNTTDEIAKGVGKVEAIGINIPGRSDTYTSKSEFDTFVNTWTNNVGAVINTKAALVKCPVDVIRRVAGDNSAGAQCCSTTTEIDADGIDRTYLNTPYFPSVEWNPTPGRCLKAKTQQRQTSECLNWGTRCTRSTRNTECNRWAQGRCLSFARGACRAWNTVRNRVCGWQRLDQEDGVPVETSFVYNPSVLKYDGSKAMFDSHNPVQAQPFSSQQQVVQKHPVQLWGWVRRVVRAARRWVCNNVYKRGSCNSYANGPCQHFARGGCTGWRHVGPYICRASVPLCKGYKFVTETVGCLLNEFSPKLKCQTARMRMELKNDQPVRYRRTARYGKKADGHINVIPGRWTPAFGCVDDKTGKAVPLKNIMFGHNEQQKATDWRTKENNSNNPGPIWLSHGWGDQMGLTSIGFVCPEGSHYKRVGKKDMPYSDSDEPAREWSSENHPGHQDNSVFLPEYRHAGMYNSMLTTGFPDMYQLCSSIDNGPRARQRRSAPTSMIGERTAGGTLKGIVAEPTPFPRSTETCPRGAHGVRSTSVSGAVT